MSIRYRSGEGELIPIIVLIIVNVVVYIAINIANLMDISITKYLALGVTTFFSEPWTIFTYMFTHQDFFHLLANMLTLYFFGSFLNRILGVKTFLTIYLVGGLVAGLFVLAIPYTLIFTSSGFHIFKVSGVIGASGAIFALGGVLTVLTPQLKVFIFPIPAPLPLWVAIVGGFLIMAIIPGVSWQGHLGGLVLGLLAGWYLRRRLRVIL
jgi:uncharacterized protein